MLHPSATATETISGERQPMRRRRRRRRRQEEEGGEEKEKGDVEEGLFKAKRAQDDVCRAQGKKEDLGDNTSVRIAAKLPHGTHDINVLKRKKKRGKEDAKEKRRHVTPRASRARWVRALGESVG